MRVTVQHDVNLRWRFRWGNVHEPETNSVTFKIHHRRPIEIAIAISTNNDHRWTQLPQALENARRADITQMPDLIRALGKLFRVRREVIVRVSENENTKHDDVLS